VAAQRARFTTKHSLKGINHDHYYYRITGQDHVQMSLQARPVLSVLQSTTKESEMNTLVGLAMLGCFLLGGVVGHFIGYERRRDSQGNGS